MKQYFFYIFLFFANSINYAGNFIKYQDNLIIEKFWQHKDYIQDSVYGISLNKWYQEDFKNTKNKIIVATIDSQIDINHEDLKGKFWVNQNEIPNNGLDDDKNGYIDDTNGWNFIGVGDSNLQAFVNFEFVRILKKYKYDFENKDTIQLQNKPIYREYKRAFEKYLDDKKYYERYLKEENVLISAYYPAKDTLHYYFPNDDYTFKQLDSLYQLHKGVEKRFAERVDYDVPSERTFSDLIYYMRMIKRYRFMLMKLIFVL